MSGGGSVSIARRAQLGLSVLLMQHALTALAAVMFLFAALCFCSSYLQRGTTKNSINIKTKEGSRARLKDRPSPAHPVLSVSCPVTRMSSLNLTICCRSAADRLFAVSSSCTDLDHQGGRQKQALEHVCQSRCVCMHYLAHLPQELRVVAAAHSLYLLAPLLLELRQVRWEPLLPAPLKERDMAPVINGQQVSVQVALKSLERGCIRLDKNPNSSLHHACPLPLVHSVCRGPLAPPDRSPSP